MHLRTTKVTELGLSKQGLVAIASSREALSLLTLQYYITAAPYEVLNNRNVTKN